MVKQGQELAKLLLVITVKFIITIIILLAIITTIVINVVISLLVQNQEMFQP